MFTQQPSDRATSFRMGRLGVVFLLLATACNFPARQTPAATEPPSTVTAARATADIEIRLSAVRLAPGKITVGAVLVNRSAEDLAGLELTLAAPAGTPAGEVLTSPLEAHVESSSGQTRWFFQAFRAQSVAGPFAVRLDFEGETPLLTANLTWQGLNPGSSTASSSLVEDASVASANLVAVSGEWAAAPETGIRAYAPGAGPGRLTVVRHDDPPSATLDPSLTWLGTFEVTKENEGAVILQVPLPQPAPPFALLRVAADHGQGYGMIPAYGTVSADGLHAAFSAEGASRYALGVGKLRLQTATSGLEGDERDSLIQAGIEVIASIANTQAQMDEFAALIGSMHTDGVLGDILGDVGWAIWGVYNEATGGGGSGPSDTSSGGSVCTPSVLGNQVCQNESDGVCGGGGSTSINHTDGSRTVYCNDDGTYDCTSGGSCTKRSGFAPVPGPCPYGVCLTDLSTGEVYTLGQIDGLSEVLQDALTRTSGVEPFVPASLPSMGGGARLDASGFTAVVSVIGDSLVILMPGTDILKISIGSPQVPPTPPPALTQVPSASPSPTPTPTVFQPVITAPPPTRTPTSTNPAPDTSGPSIKSVADSPDPIKVSQPKGCSPTTSTVSAAISDPSGVQSAFVLFFHTTIGQVAMTHGSGNSWSAVLGPYAGIGDGTIDYQIRAIDGQGNTTDSAFGQITILACLP